MSHTVTCPECGNRSPWDPPARVPATPVPFDEVDPEARRGVRVRCLARPPGVSRQMRRQAERTGQPIVCGAEFIVRPLPPDDEQAIDSGQELPDPDRPLNGSENWPAPRSVLPFLLMAAMAGAAPPRGRR